jgi:alpha-L-fucosidase 2
LTLHYDRPAHFFEEALPVGNGRLGAMVYGDPVHEYLSLNDITLWTGEPDKGTEHPDLVTLGLTGDGAEALKAVREALDNEDYAAAERLQRGLQGHFSESYMPLGTLRIDYDTCAVSAYER